MQYGTMLQDVELLGTSLALQKGQRVSLIPTMNQPNTGNWFARPANGFWSDGIDHSPTDSILLGPGDVRVDQSEIQAALAADAADVEQSDREYLGILGDRNHD